jgi:hypothetical protein
MSAGPPLSTLLLDPTTWDLVLDVSGNIAVASGPYAAAQDIASAVRTFLGECWYDRTQGVPYLQTILGKNPPIGVFQAAIVAAAESVPGVASAVCVISSFSAETREVVGQIQFRLNDGTTGAVPL